MKKNDDDYNDDAFFQKYIFFCYILIFEAPIK